MVHSSGGVVAFVLSMAVLARELSMYCTWPILPVQGDALGTDWDGLGRSQSVVQGDPKVAFAQVTGTFRSPSARGGSAALEADGRRFESARRLRPVVRRWSTSARPPRSGQPAVTTAAVATTAVAVRPATTARVRRRDAV